jgi:2-desacetyl-2-hydroxyethyl bacteriochlorophyllide A dehydrogenase
MMKDSESARAVYFTGPGRIEVRDERIERRPGDKKVDSHLIGISHGTEMILYSGCTPASPSGETLPSLADSFSYPVKYGYSNAGVTQDGDRVFVFYPHQDRFYVQPEQCIPLPDGLAFEDAVFLANMETAMGIVHDAHCRFGETVLVLGQGIVGLLTAELLMRGGVGRLVTVDPLPLRRSYSERLGCIAVDPAEGSVPELVRHLTNGRGADVAINTSGSDEGLQAAIDSLTIEGTVVEASWYGSRTAGIKLGEAFHRKRLSIRSSQVSHIGSCLQPRWNKQRRLDHVIGLLQTIQPSRYITHRYSLSDAPAAFRLLGSRSDEVVQIVLYPERKSHVQDRNTT